MINLANMTMLDFAATALPSNVYLSSLHPISSSTSGYLLPVYVTASQYLTWSTLWAVLFMTLVAANFKAVPFVYHLRLLNGLRHVCTSQRSSKPLTPDQLFQPLITSSRAPLMEVDVLGHKSNSTYFSDIDIARVHLVTTLFSKAIEKVRGSTTMNGLSGKSRSNLNLALGAVSCVFKREIKPYEPYDMYTRILTFDEKWIYILTTFVKKEAGSEPKEFTLYPKQINSQNNSRKNSTVDTESSDSQSDIQTARSSGNIKSHEQRSPIAASALSKVVFKQGRLTVAPEVMLEAAGLLPPRSFETVSTQATRLAAAQIKANEQEVVEQECVADLALNASTSIADDNTAETSRSMTTRKTIEAERIRGMEVADLLAQQSALENEWDNEIALGRHYDGFGIAGVVSTLAQLGKLSSYQLL